MLVMNFKDRWRAAELGSAIEQSLMNEPVWLKSSHQTDSLGPITRKLSNIVINDFRRVDTIPKQLNKVQLMSVFYSGFSVLINQSLNGNILTKPDYAIIELARIFAADIDLSHNQELQDHAETVINTACNWDKHIRNLNQRKNTRFVI
ncbi:hypothetical protein [Shewanella donghaensis]|uniref:hypothetical protein n=1 Tax=Shewanella donghaensis TaxID=238836 RepID=UPI00118378A4|nr:hypothetical protein [Shewanella donghaensis]